VANSVWSYWLPFSSSCGSSARQKPEFFWSLGFVVQERRPGRRCPGAEAWASLSRSGGLGVVVQERRPGRRCPGAEAWSSLSRMTYEISSFFFLLLFLVLVKKFRD